MPLIMNPKRVFALFGFFFFISAAWGQSKLPALDSTYFKVKILKLNLLSPVVRAFGVGYEVSRNQSSSFQINGLFGGGGFLITPEYRYYLSSTPAPKGTFVAPFLNYGKFDNEEIYGGGLVLGHQGFFKKKITIDVFFGPSYQLGDYFDGGQFLVRGGLFIGLNLKKPPQ